MCALKGRNYKTQWQKRVENQNWRFFTLTVRCLLLNSEILQIEEQAKTTLFSLFLKLFGNLVPTKVGIELLKTDEMVGDCFRYTIPTFPQNCNHVHIQVVSRSVDQVGFQKILRISTL